MFESPQLGSARTLLGVAWLLLSVNASGGSTASAAVAGSLRDQAGDPLSSALVQLKFSRLDVGSRTASVRTDGQGRFSFPQAAGARVSITAKKPRYFVESINGQAAQALTLDCSRDDVCADVRIVMAAAGSIEGVVADHFSEPIEGVDVALSQADVSGDARYAQTDDRGAFRFGGLRPGRYRIHATAAMPEPPHAIAYRGRIHEVELELGSTISNLAITMERVDTYSVSGRVGGVDMGKSAATLNLYSVGGEDFGSWSSAVQSDGSFEFGQVPAGLYEVVLRADRGKERLRLLRVDGTLSELLLTPLPATGVEGRVDVPDGTPLKAVSIEFKPLSDTPGRAIAPEPPEYRFEVTDLFEGEYQVIASSPSFYVGSLSGDREDLTGDRLSLSVGELRRMEIVIRDDFGQITGRIKQSRVEAFDPVRAASHYRVAVRGPDGVCSVPADQNGRFHFERVKPGDYRIAAWFGASEAEVRDDELWEEAKAKVRAFPVEPGDEIELDITAAQ